MSALEKIDHFVVLMMENRSFDSVLGWLYEGDARPSRTVPEPSPDAGPDTPGGPCYDRSFNGLDGVDFDQFVNRAELHYQSFALPPVRGASSSNVPDVSPLEHYHDVNEQLYGNRGNPAPGSVPPMTGFLENFARCMGIHASGMLAGISEEEQLARLPQVMESYTPAQLPVLNGLARAHAVSDLWFASVPTQTNANRAFLLCGTSMGGVNNAYHSPEGVPGSLHFDRYNARTVFNVLHEQGIDWSVFYHDFFPPWASPWNSRCFTRNAYTGLEEIGDVDEHFLPIEEFHRQARRGELPAFSYLEPSWGFGYTDEDAAAQLVFTQKGNDFHPPRNMKLGENLIQSVYESLAAHRESWERTLLIITFDEHVGSFDHVPPPWNATPPWGHKRPPYPTQFEFGFDRFGVRVGTLLISPWVSAGTVFRSEAGVPYDHTSIAATVFRRHGIPQEQWRLGHRMEQAPTFEKVLDRSEPRTDRVEPRRVAVGQPLRGGDQVLLRNERTGDYLTTSPPRAGMIQDQTRYREAAAPRAADTGRASFNIFTGMEEQVVRNNSRVQLGANQLSLEEKIMLTAVEDDPQCVYAARDYRGQAAAAQSWTVRRYGEPPDDSPIVCGDIVYLTSQTDGPLGQRGSEIVSSPTQAPDAWKIEHCPAPADSRAPISFGDLVYLQCLDTGDYVTSMEHGAQFYPTLANVGPVELKIAGGSGHVNPGDSIQLCTTERAVEQYNLLGAWRTKWCYYYTPHDNAKQSWFIERTGGQGPILFGDSLRLVNMAWRQVLACEDGYLTTEKKDRFLWRFAPHA